MIAIPIAYFWAMFALTLVAWERALRFGKHANRWCWFSLGFMIPATAGGTTILAAWLS